MASLKKHGAEIGRIEYAKHAKAYMADGAVLVNHGWGWKLHAKCKSGVSPQAAYESARDNAEKFLAARPAFRRYKDALHNLAGLSKRWKLHAAVEVMMDDPDGVWSEVCDGYGDNVAADISEVSHLCDLFKCALEEQKHIKSGGPLEARRAS